MDFFHIREILLEISDKAPCDVLEFSRQKGFKFSMPAISPDGHVLGPSNIPQEELKKQLKGKTHADIVVKPSKLGEEEKLLFLQLCELKLIHFQSHPEKGTIESVAPSGRKSYSPRVLGLTAKGADFLELSKDRMRLSRLLDNLVSRRALTFSNLLRELNRSARNEMTAIE